MINLKISGSFVCEKCGNAEGRINIYNNLNTVAVQCVKCNHEETAKVKASNLILISEYDKKLRELENEMPNIISLINSVIKNDTNNELTKLDFQVERQMCFSPDGITTSVKDYEGNNISEYDYHSLAEFTGNITDIIAIEHEHQSFDSSIYAMKLYPLLSKINNQFTSNGYEISICGVDLNTLDERKELTLFELGENYDS